MGPASTGSVGLLPAAAKRSPDAKRGFRRMLIAYPAHTAQHLSSPSSKSSATRTNKFVVAVSPAVPVGCVAFV